MLAASFNETDNGKNNSGLSVKAAHGERREGSIVKESCGYIFLQFFSSHSKCFILFILWNISALFRDYMCVWLYPDVCT